MKKIICLLACLSVGSVNATIIDFEGFGSNTIIGDEDVGNGLDIGASNGFEFTSSGDHFHFGSGLFGVPSNGTSILLQDRSYFITMSQVGGGSFSFLSGDFGEDISFGVSNSATAITVTGFLSGGGTIVQNYTLDGDASFFETFNIIGLNNVSSVSFEGVGGGFTLDNLTVASPVSEPLPLALMGLGLAGISLLRRKKTN